MGSWEGSREEERSLVSTHPPLQIQDALSLGALLAFCLLGKGKKKGKEQESLYLNLLHTYKILIFLQKKCSFRLFFTLLKQQKKQMKKAGQSAWALL